MQRKVDRATARAVGALALAAGALEGAPHAAEGSGKCHKNSRISCCICGK
ncbi:MAG: hypothetical protein IPI72_17800 [Flavobacteriales bacterium]|nr:hypothetical protein [Flavobacteriales bacterium]